MGRFYLRGRADGEMDEKPCGFRRGRGRVRCILSISGVSGVPSAGNGCVLPPKRQCGRCCGFMEQRSRRKFLEAVPRFYGERVLD